MNCKGECYIKDKCEWCDRLRFLEKACKGWKKKEEK